MPRTQALLAEERNEIMPPPESMWRGTLFSLLIHASVIASTLIAMPQFRDDLPPLPSPVIVDVVDISDITNLPPTPKTPSPKKVEAPPVEKPTPAEPLPKKPKQPDQKQEVKAAPLPTEKTKPPEPKKEEKPKPDPKKAADDFSSVLKTVEKFKQQAPTEPEVPTPDSKSFAQAQNFIPSLPLSISETDAVRRQIEQCWNLPAGARDAHNLAVEVWVAMNPDGTVQQARVTNDNGRSAVDPFFRAASESALRALMNPRCTPLKLPLDKYHQWQTMTLNFDPKLMLGY